MKRIILAMFCGLLVIGCAACSDTGFEPVETTPAEETEEPITEQPTLSSEDIAGLLSQTTPAADAPSSVDPVETPQEAAQGEFGTAVWLAKADEDDAERFFLFYENGNGTYLEQETGTGMGFTYELTDGENAVFHIGAADDVTNAKIYWMDSEHAQISWEDGAFETLTRLPDDPREEFRFYSNEVLRERALSVYEQKNGFRPEEARIWYNYDEMISIQIMDKVDDHEFTCDWYTIDRFTGVGTNLLGERINLSDTPDAVETVPAESSAPMESTVPGQTEAPTETTETTPTQTTADFRRR